MKFYYVTTEKKYDGTTKYIHDESEKFFCDKCGKVYKSIRKAPFQVQFIGKQKIDMYQEAGCYIANEKVRNVLEKYGITGYGIRGIDCVGWVDKRNKPLNLDASEYCEITVLGKCGRMCDLEGNVIEGCPECGSAYRNTNRVRGISVDESTWDGSDIFTFSNWLGVMICTEKMKEAFEKEKIKGMQFFPIEQYIRF